MKAAGGDARFTPAPLPLPPRRCGGVAMRCLCGLLAWPWLTMLAVVATAVGLSMFDARMRDALGTADEASYIVAGPGLRHWTAVARSCVMAATVVRQQARVQRRRAACTADAQSLTPLLLRFCVALGAAAAAAAGRHVPGHLAAGGVARLGRAAHLALLGRVPPQAQRRACRLRVCQRRLCIFGGARAVRRAVRRHHRRRRRQSGGGGRQLRRDADQTGAPVAVVPPPPHRDAVSRSDGAR